MWRGNNQTLQRKTLPASEIGKDFLNIRNTKTPFKRVKGKPYSGRGVQNACVQQRNHIWNVKRVTPNK